MAIPEGPTKLVVGGTIGAVLVLTIYTLLGPVYGSIAALYLLYEGWTIVNRYARDTISEVTWYLATRPLVPLMFGAGISWAIVSGLIPRTHEGLWVAFMIGTLYGHLFWQSQEIYDGIVRGRE